MATLKENINDAWKNAMRAGDKNRRDTLSMLRAAIKSAEINARSAENSAPELDDGEVQGVIEREAKKRRDAIEEYERAGRADRADMERAELGILQEFLPAPLSDEELETLTSQVIAETGATGKADMGKVMQAVMPRTEGRADGKRVNAVVRRLLGA